MSQDNRTKADSEHCEHCEHCGVPEGMMHNSTCARGTLSQHRPDKCPWCGTLNGIHDVDCVRLNEEYREPGGPQKHKFVEKEPESAKVKKFDTGKPDLSYVMDAPIAMEGFSRIMKLGETKYGRSNWKLHDDPNRLVAAMLRHLMAWQNGEEIDPESNLSHLYHVVANSVMLAENFTLNNQENNDDNEKEN